MSNKYDIYHESGWLDNNQSPSYEKITTVKNERAAIDFATNIENISRYGDMLIRMKSGGSVWTYNDRNGEWER